MGGQVAQSRAALTIASPLANANDVVNLANANVGGMACTKNSLGGDSFESSCTGNGGQPEYWCADFVQWVWANSGVDTTGLDAAAGSFYVYGQKNGTLKDTPAIGDAVVFDYQGGGVATHVAIVTKVNSDGTIESVSGDWNGDSGSQATFASTSHVVLNAPAYDATVGGTPSVIGMAISGYVAPVGLTPYAASFVAQSFPFATTALTMTAGQTIPSYIEMKNTGGQTWSSSTRLATSQPRDRASAFADSSWISPNRLAAVNGTVRPGGTFRFQFDLHAPDQPGTYYEYFDLVQENVAWFGDPGQGGPPDDDLEVQVLVVAAPESDAGGRAETTDAGSGRTGGGDAGALAAGGGDDAGHPGKAPAPADGAAPGSEGASSGDVAAPASASGGCDVAPAAGGERAAAWLFVALAVAARRRRLACGRRAIPVAFSP
jgi:hypothetical protein